MDFHPLQRLLKSQELDQNLLPRMINSKHAVPTCVVYEAGLCPRLIELNPDVHPVRMAGIWRTCLLNSRSCGHSFKFCHIVADC